MNNAKYVVIATILLNNGVDVLYAGNFISSELYTLLDDNAKARCAVNDKYDPEQAEILDFQNESLLEKMRSQEKREPKQLQPKKN